VCKIELNKKNLKQLYVYISAHTRTLYNIYVLSQVKNIQHKKNNKYFHIHNYAN